MLWQETLGKKDCEMVPGKERWDSIKGSSARNGDEEAELGVDLGGEAT